jgi:hypothetical protein
MVADGWVVPGNTTQSKVYIEINPGPNGEPPLMPTAQGGGPLAATDIATVNQWITCGAQDWTGAGSTGTGTEVPAGARGFITPQMVFTAVRADLGTLSPVQAGNQPDQVDARYLSLVNLYNAGVPADRIKLFAQGLNKQMWSLTEERSPPNLVAVNLDGVVLSNGAGTVSISEGLGQSLIWRIDEKDFLWDAAALNADHDNWEELVKAYPFGVQFDNTFDEARDVVLETHTRVPIMNGDWFDDRASLPPLYFDVLDIPNDFDTYYQDFGAINEQQEFDDANLDCVGMNGDESLVSNFNRIQCRFQSLNGYCWNSSDFATEAGQANIFAFPLNFLTARAGGEAFCSLPDGQQSYFVFVNQGNGVNARLDDAPSNVVTDYSPDSDRVVHTGQSCEHCHESGVIERDDDILDAVENPDAGFDSNTRAEVEDRFPGNSELPGIYQTDIGQFTNSLNRMGVAVGEEPTWAISRDYERPLELPRAAAVFGVRDSLFLGQVSTNGQLQAQYSGLFNGTTNTIDFQIAEGAALQTICDLSVGDNCDATDLAMFKAGGVNFNVFCGEVRKGIFVGNPVPCPNGSVCNA